MSDALPGAAASPGAMGSTAPSVAPAPTGAPEDSATSSSRLISAGAVMAAGTLLSRVMGFGRFMLLVLLFGNGTRQADMFTLANTVPNSMYILLAGGVLNTVLVPQIVRAIKNDADGGEAYTNRIMTAGLLGLGIITAGLTLAVPLVINLYSAASWKAPGSAAQYDSMTMLAYYCMPQIFFYGVHVLAGQVLNARDRFGPMMWAPIANNVVSIVVLVLFLVVFGRGNPGQPFTDGEELLLGLGSTLGIAAQAAVLVPYLRAVGYRFRPRFDFRHTGLGKTVTLAKWTLGFVLVSQLALVVVTKLATGATAGGAGAGLTAYASAHALWILPHSLITVSLATAMLPSASRLAAAGDTDGVRDETVRTMRLAVTALLPAAVAFAALGLPMTRLLFGFGAGSRDSSFVGWALIALALGLVPFTVQYICLRTFYALEDTRSTFFLQVVISGSNALLGVVIVTAIDRPSWVAAGLGVAYSLAYVIGVCISFAWLRHRLPGLSAGALVRHCARLLGAVAPAGLVAFGIPWAFSLWSSSRWVLALSLVVAGLVATGIFVGLSRLLHIREVGEIVATMTRRGRSGTGAALPTPVPTPASAADDTLNDGHDPASPGDTTVQMAAISPTIKAASTAVPATPARTVSVSSPVGPIRNVESMVSHAGAMRPNEPRAGDPDQDASNPHPGDEALLDEQRDDERSVDPAVPIGKNASLPAGTLLANRYRLEELLAEAAPTVTWRAFDQVLSRSVLVHLLPPNDPGAPGLLDAARQAAAATDSRFLRVLDAVHSDHPELGSYIVCEYATGQSLEAILSRGPLSGLEAAWVVREVADALSGVHILGLYHRRINPDTVIITPTGNIKIVGLLIEAHLRPSRSAAVPGADTPELVDVMDLGRLLYAALVSRWPGGPAHSLADAPVLGHRWMTPRQVRAGVSPALDNVCDQILGAPPRHKAAPVTTVNGVVNALTKVLGTADASNDLERRLRQPIPRVNGTDGPALISPLLDQTTEQMSAVDRPGTSAAAMTVLTPSTAPASPHPSSASTPPRRGTSAATEAGPTTLIRTPTSPGSHPVSSAAKSSRSRRRWIPLVIVLALLLIGGGVVGAVIVSRRSEQPQGANPTPSASSSAQPPGPSIVAVKSARDFDPQGGDKTENPDEVKLAYDGNPETRWRTVNYLRNPLLGGIKRGVGLVFDLGEAKSVSRVEVSLSGNRTTVEARVPKTDPDTRTSPPMSSDSQWRVVDQQSKVGKTATLTFDEAVTTRYVLVYLTSLPKEGNGYRGGIYEVEVFQ